MGVTGVGGQPSRGGTEPLPAGHTPTFRLGQQGSMTGFEAGDPTPQIGHLPNQTPIFEIPWRCRGEERS
jgi:hypothetical protein